MIKPVPFTERKITLLKREGHYVGEFFAMGCPCQILVETDDWGLAKRLVAIAREQAWRIEAHWSRYLPQSLVQKINTHPTQSHEIDTETALILDYCEQLWSLSDGAFDITSGVLRRLWTFDGRSSLPDRESVDRLLECVGWQKVRWSRPTLALADAMEIDFGGVGKEYAVDLCCSKLSAQTDASCLVNFGGDCAVTVPPKKQVGWRVGIEGSEVTGSSVQIVELSSGALATSGDAHRYVMDGERKLSHIMDARTGWPMADAPASVTVGAETCLEAGMLATLACLKGGVTETFLEAEATKYWIQWH